MNGSNPMKRQCSATNRQGKQCGKYPILGGSVCRLHGGAAPQVAQKAARRVADMLADAIDPDRVLREAGRLAYSDIRELYDEQGKLLPIKQWPDDIARCVKSIESVRGNVDKGDGQFDDVVKVQLWDKTGKLQDLMKHHGQLSDTLNVNLNVNIGERLRAARKRLNGNGG
jgi:terminase small subunit-like protein